MKTPVWKPYALLILLCALPCVAMWRALAATFSLAWRNDECTHILLIMPVSIVLIAQHLPLIRRPACRGVRVGSAIHAISLGIAGTGLLWHRATSDERLAIWMLAVVTWWIGAFVLSMGTRASRPVLFPLLFLFGLVPIPQAALEVVIALLQQASAWFAGLLFSLCGVPVVRDGVLLAIPGLSLMVSQECSSIRSSSMLLVTTLVLAHILLQSRWRRACLIALVIPISLAKNGLRIFTIGMLTTKVDPEYITGRFHRQGGIIFFAAALAAIFGILHLFRRGDARNAVTDSSAKAAPVRIGDLTST